MIEVGLVELAIPAVVSALIVAARNFSAKLDGPAAYWWSVGLNVVAQVAAELAAGDGGFTAATLMQAGGLGLGTGAVVGPGLATSGKRLGAGKLIKPREAPTR